MRRVLWLRTEMDGDVLLMPYAPQGKKQIGPGPEQQVFLNYLRYSKEFEMGYVQLGNVKCIHVSIL